MKRRQFMVKLTITGLRQNQQSVLNGESITPRLKTTNT